MSGNSTDPSPPSPSMTGPDSGIAAHEGKPIGWDEALRTWARVSLLSFGGPSGQIAVMHRILVDEKRWITEESFLHALNFCMLLPGPEAQQLATYLGWLLHRTLGGIVAGTLFILPGFFSILGLSLLYVEYRDAWGIAGLFLGLKAAVLAIVVEAVIRIGRRVLRRRALLVVSVISFLAIFLLGLPFPWIVLAAGVVGYVGGLAWPRAFLPNVASTTPPTLAKSAEEARRALDTASSRQLPLPTWGRALQVSVLCLTLWWTPVALVAAWQGTNSIYVQQGLFFSKTAMVTFGGAYSVLSYVAQQAVVEHAWLSPQEMLDGLGLAETTPGPLIMVVQFVAFLGAYRNPGTLSPLQAGLVGSVLTTWVTFVPCFYWIFLGAPHIERLRAHRGWNATLTTITAAVVGVILNLAVWFAAHTLFESVATVTWGPFQVLLPELETWHWDSAVISAVALLLTFWLRRGMAQTLALCAALGVLLTWL